MCKDCEKYKKENLFVEESIPAGVRKHLLANLHKYRIRFNIPSDRALTIKKSGKDDKRFALYEDDEKMADFGFAAIVNGRKRHAQTFIDLVDEQPAAARKKKREYIARAGKITDGDGEYTHNKRYTPNSLSYWLLWHCPMCH